METAVTKTADFDGTTKDLGQGFAPGSVGMPAAVVVNTTAIKTSATNETYSFVLEESSDGETFTACGAAAAVTAVGSISVAGFISHRYVRVRLDVGGTDPSITYNAWLVPLAQGMV